MSSHANAIGLDVGTSRIVKALQNGGDFEFESQINAFVTVPYSKITANVLEKEGVPHSVQGGEIVVHGNESEKFADLLNAETRKTMTRGVLDAREPESLTQMRSILGSLLGGPGKGRKLVFTVPAAPIGHEENSTYHEATLKQIFGDMGFEAKSINEGLAVVYGEMEATNFTGIGVSCGGGLCNVCLSYLAVPVVSFSIAKAGDYIDASAAQVTGERANRIRIAKEGAFHFNGFFADKTQQVISVYYDDMIRSLVAALNDAFSLTRAMPKLTRPIPLVLSGGTSIPDGFRDRFEKILAESKFPVPLSEIRMAANPLHTTAKGALVAALSE